MNEAIEACPYCEIVQPAVAAHRGASRRYPENSLAAFKEAINIAMEHPEVRFFIEMDVRATKDGKLVLMHDADVSRTTRGSGHVEDMTFAEIQALKMKPVSEIVPDGHTCADRAQNPLFPVTAQDLRVPSLEEVLNVVREANRERGNIGSPIGLALEVKPKPPTRFFSRWTALLASMLSTLLDKVGLTWLADKMLAPTPSITPLAEMLNQHAQHGETTPVLVFSAAGAIGKRDLKELWRELSPEAKLGMMHQSGRRNPSLPYVADDLARAMALNGPHSAPFTDMNHNMPLMNAAQKAAGIMETFWLIGSLTPETKVAKRMAASGIPVLTNFTPLDDPRDIQEAISSGTTLITANYPERAIRILKEYARANPDSENIAMQPAPTLEGHFAKQEMQRRERSAAAYGLAGAGSNGCRAHGDKNTCR
ncbi:MAG: glycerophosphodiester phosphodiesterase family protein [Pseudomonadota bacterium]|nr:glycerophosphodiester phosphodiesterase family protein [Pseudomonadota bacterium]